MLKINTTGREFDVTDSIKSFLQEKLDKSEGLLKKAVKIDVEMAKIGEDKVDDNLKLEITVFMPNAVLRVEEKGEDMYGLIDKSEVILRRRLKRYNEKIKNWEKQESWKVSELEKHYDSIESGIVDEELDPNFASFTPKIVKHKQYSDDMPMHPNEAIERMELIGHKCFLFRNIETDKYTMVYKRLDGNYGLVEPKENN